MTWPQSMYVCEKCQSRMVTNDEWVEHMRSHLLLEAEDKRPDLARAVQRLAYSSDDPRGRETDGA